MASLNEVYIKTETLEKVLKTLKKKGEKGVKLIAAIQDETNDWNQNVSVFVSQTKEQREEKAKKFYVGNGRTFWTDGTIKQFEYKEGSSSSENNSGGDGDLPF